MNNIPFTIVGNLTADPELRYTPNGVAVANFTVAHTPRYFDKQANEWKDGDATFLRCNAWRELGENVAESLTRGTAVVVTGYFKARQYETKEGEKRTSYELEAEHVGPDLRRATAKVTKAQRAGGGQPQQQGGWNQQTGRGGFGGDSNSDPWATQGQQTSTESPF